jgi:hypothetical protein
MVWVLAKVDLASLPPPNPYRPPQSAEMVRCAAANKLSRINSHPPLFGFATIRSSSITQPQP